MSTTKQEYGEGDRELFDALKRHTPDHDQYMSDLREKIAAQPERLEMDERFNPESSPLQAAAGFVPTFMIPAFLARALGVTAKAHSAAGKVWSGVFGIPALLAIGGIAIVLVALRFVGDMKSDNYQRDAAKIQRKNRERGRRYGTPLRIARWTGLISVAMVSYSAMIIAGFVALAIALRSLSSKGHATREDVAWHCQDLLFILMFPPVLGSLGSQAPFSFALPLTLAFGALAVGFASASEKESLASRIFTPLPNFLFSIVFCTQVLWFPSPNWILEGQYTEADWIRHELEVTCTDPTWGGDAGEVLAFAEYLQEFRPEFDLGPLREHFRRSFRTLRPKRGLWPALRMGWITPEEVAEPFESTGEKDAGPLHDNWLGLRAALWNHELLKYVCDPTLTPAGKDNLARRIISSYKAAYQQAWPPGLSELVTAHTALSILDRPEAFDELRAVGQNSLTRYWPKLEFASMRMLRGMSFGGVNPYRQQYDAARLLQLVGQPQGLDLSFALSLTGGGKYGTSVGQSFGNDVLSRAYPNVAFSNETLFYGLLPAALAALLSIFSWFVVRRAKPREVTALPWQEGSKS